MCLILTDMTEHIDINTFFNDTNLLMNNLTFRDGYLRVVYLIISKIDVIMKTISKYEYNFIHWIKFSIFRNIIYQNRFAIGSYFIYIEFGFHSDI